MDCSISSPSSRPATTSVTQWKPRYTLVPTRITGGAQRINVRSRGGGARSAHSTAYHTIELTAWPDGYETPAPVTACGAGRSTIHLSSSVVTTVRTNAVTTSSTG